MTLTKVSESVSQNPGMQIAAPVAGNRRSSSQRFTLPNQFTNSSGLDATASLSNNVLNFFNNPAIQSALARPIVPLNVAALAGGIQPARFQAIPNAPAAPGRLAAPAAAVEPSKSKCCCWNLLPLIQLIASAIFLSASFLLLSGLVVTPLLIAGAVAAGTAVLASTVGLLSQRCAEAQTFIR